MYALFSAFLLAISLLATPAMAVEEINYKVAQQDDNIQIRLYEPTVAAEVTLEGERREVIGDAFRILFDYIQGNNQSKATIEMTAPVSQAAQPQEIPMTAPVSQMQEAENTWTIAFYMPTAMTYETAPTPLDKRITMRHVPAKRMAAITFSGTSSDANMQEHETALRDYLTTHNIAHQKTALYAFYDAPYVPWFLRRNEVLFTLD